MSELSLMTHVCQTMKEVEATEGDMLNLIDGLGLNILQHLGEVELGITIRVFLRDE